VDDCRDGYECITHSLGGDAVSVCDALTSEPLDPDAGADGGGEAEVVELDHNYGDPCLSSAECEAAGGLSATCVTGFEDGYCSATCDPAALNQCGESAYCLRSSVGGICVLQCASDPNRCRPTYGCCQLGGLHACLPTSTVDGCTAVGPGGDGALGDNCTEDLDCGAGTDPGCYLEVPGGQCTSWGCRQDLDCGDGGVCSVGFTSLCLAECDGADDCREDQECCRIRPDATACVATGFCEE
jgi:hypothetical protein